MSFKLIDFVRESQQLISLEPLHSDEDKPQVRGDLIYQQIIDEFPDEKPDVIEIKESPHKPKSSAPLRAFTKIVVHKFLSACHHGNTSLVKSILRRFDGNIVNQTDGFGWTSLMCAIASHSFDIIQLILAVPQLDLEIKNSQQQTAFDVAMKFGCQDVFQFSVNDQTNDQFPSDAQTNEDLPFCKTCNEVGSSEHNSSVIHQFKSNFGRELRPHFMISESNPGYQLLRKHGWSGKGALSAGGVTYPLKTRLRRDRRGLGLENDIDCPLKVTHFKPFEEASVKRSVIPVEKTLSRKERLHRLNEKHKRHKRIACQVRDAFKCPDF